MKLNDKIYEAIHLEIYKNESDNCDGFQDSANKVEIIADEFAIGFAEFIIKNYQLDGVFLGILDMKDLIKDYKKETEL